MELWRLQTLKKTGDGLGEVPWPIKTRPGVMVIAGKLRPHAAILNSPLSAPHPLVCLCSTHRFPLFPSLRFWLGNLSCLFLTPSIPQSANQTHLELPRAPLGAGSASNSWSKWESRGGNATDLAPITHWLWISWGDFLTDGSLNLEQNQRLATIRMCAARVYACPAGTKCVGAMVHTVCQQKSST